MKSNQLVGFLVAALLSTGAVWAQDEGMGGMWQGMGKHRAEMVEMHKKIAEQLKTEDAELDKLAAEMNAATGEKKIDAIAAVVNKMVEQRKAWHAQMGAMHEKMQEWMKGKMEGGKMGRPGMKGMMEGSTPVPTTTP